MTRFRAKIYYMYENERTATEDAVKQGIIKEPEWTPGYAIGVLDKSDITKLEKKGLAVTLIEEITTPQAAAAGEMAMPHLMTAHTLVNRRIRSAKKSRPGKKPSTPVAPVPLTAPKSSTSDKIISQDTRREQYYIVRFHGPLTEPRKKELRKHKIKLQERLTRNKYTVQLKPSEVKTLGTISFVDAIRLYTLEDTLREEVETSPSHEAVFAGEIKKAAKAVKAPEKRTQIYSVRVHQPKELRTVVSWLKKKKRKPLAQHKDVLHVALIDESPMLMQLANLPEVARVMAVEMPRLMDDQARKILSLEISGSNPFGLEGSGEIVAIADTGIDLSHPDFAGRVVGTSAWGRKGNVSDPAGHGTHVAGCVAGDGQSSGGVVKGAAPKAKVFFQSILDDDGKLGGLPSDLGDLFKEAYAKGARIHNNSWGAFNFARYAVSSQDVDRFVANNPDMLVVIAAGNDGIAVPRVNGSQTTSSKGFVDWPCVASPATAKNGLTVGASRNSRTKGGYSQLTWGDAWEAKYPDAPISTEKISGDVTCLAAFSSRGPCDDQRIKPDVVAPGTDIAAARSKDAPLHNFWGAYPGNKHYGFMGGTSMAAPYVAGCAALVREWYRTIGGAKKPSAALLKATLINGTKRLNGKCSTAPLEGDPNFHQGFGRIDMINTLPNSASGLKLEFLDTWQSPKLQFTKSGEAMYFDVQVGKSEELRLCLCWTDPPARALQNSLVLMVDNGAGKKVLGNENAAVLLHVAGAPRDPNNNVQIIRIPKPTAGNYLIGITASTILVPKQAFSLVVTGDLKSPLNLVKHLK